MVKAIVATVFTLALVATSGFAAALRSADGVLTIQGYQFNSDVSAILTLSDQLAQLDRFVDVDRADPASYVPRMQAVIDASMKVVQPGALGEPQFDLYTAFWKDETFVTNQVRSVLNAEGDFATIATSAMARQAGVGAALRYSLIFQGMIHEMELAYSSFRTKDFSSARSHWDRAAALYLGSNVDTKSRTGNVGSMLFKLSNELCQAARTCSTDDGMYGDSRNNVQIIEYLVRGATFLASPADSNIMVLENIKRTIIGRLIIPSLQFLVKQSYKLDPKKQTIVNNEDKARAHIHTLAILPRLAACNANDAKKLLASFSVNAEPYLPIGYLGTADLIASFLPCLALRCRDLGGYTSYYVTEIDECEDPSDDDNNHPSQPQHFVEIPGAVNLA